VIGYVKENSSHGGKHSVKKLIVASSMSIYGEGAYECGMRDLVAWGENRGRSIGLTRLSRNLGKRN
jgi:hypothetical protein